MTKQDFYNQLPSLAKRLFTLGLGAALAFLVFWYYGGHNLWGYFLGGVFKITGFFMNIHFQSGNSENAAFFYTFALEDGRMANLTFPINRLNSNMVEVVTLLAIWIYRPARSFFRIALWCLLFTVLYHWCHVVLQLYIVKIGPNFANNYHIFWEQTAWYLIVNKIATFDMLLLRYWAGFPIFLFALVTDYFFGKRKGTSKKPKKTR